MCLPGDEEHGLAMTRAFGDLETAEFGVTHEPSVLSLQVPLDIGAFIVLASDGVWDVLPADEALPLAGRKARSLFVCICVCAEVTTLFIFIRRLVNV